MEELECKPCGIKWDAALRVYCLNCEDKGTPVPHQVTAAEAGKKGGTTVRDTHGPDFYTTIGKKGGAAVRDSAAPGFYAEIGRRGGAKVRDSRGPNFYKEIGKKGGDAAKAKHGPDFYKSIGAKGGAKVREAFAAMRAAEANGEKK